MAQVAGGHRRATGVAGANEKNKALALAEALSNRNDPVIHVWKNLEGSPMADFAHARRDIVLDARRRGFDLSYNIESTDASRPMRQTGMRVI
jgi:hypothetical protein